MTAKADRVPSANLIPRPVVAIIIDDIGYRLRDGQRAIDLPGTLTYSFLPHTPHARQLADQAHHNGDEVMLHIPMEPMAQKALGPGGLTIDMGRRELADTVTAGLTSIPYVRGVSNHMGSMLTRMGEPMRWLMETIQARGGLFFVDNRTTGRSIAGAAAKMSGLPTMNRDIFLDHEPTPQFIRAQFNKLVRKAKREGSAIAVGHPYPETLGMLKKMLPDLKKKGIRMVTASQLLEIRQNRARWRLSLSPSLTKVKTK